MTNTTCIYIKDKDKYLFLNRNKKKNDMNKDKYIGVGGHQIEGESIEDCLKREVKEETGCLLSSYTFKGIVHFFNNKFYDQDIYLYIGELQTNDIQECNEGSFVWVDKKDIMSLPLWEGDKYFLEILLDESDNRTFELTLCYEDDELTKVDGPYFMENH